MGLDMNVYATNGENLTKENLWDEDIYLDLNSWYWRKANCIHKWMVKNVQDDVDDCDVYEVDVNQLRELKDLVEEVMEDPEKASDLIPTTVGFFFGSTDYDEGYRNDLDLTLTHINQMLEEYSMGETRFFYNSSW